jgi:hypothetical protein
MEHVSSRVHDFIRATETLLSPVSTGPLSDEEREQIIFYAKMIIDQLAQSSASVQARPADRNESGIVGFTSP